MPQPLNATTETITANTLAWTSWTITNLTRMDGFEADFLVFCPHFTSASLVEAIYVNGVLVSNTTDTIPGTPVGTGVGGAGTLPPSLIYPGTVVSLAILCTPPLTAYVSNIGQTYEARVDSLPGRLPSSPSVLPYTLQMYAFRVG